LIQDELFLALLLPELFQLRQGRRLVLLQGYLFLTAPCLELGLPPGRIFLGLCPISLRGAKRLLVLRLEFLYGALFLGPIGL